MRTGRSILFFLAISKLTLAATAAPLSIKVAGNRLVNGDGQTVRLLGVNRPGTEYACIQGWGIFDGPDDAASVRPMKQWNINTVRIPLNEDCWLGTRGVNPSYSGTNYQKAIGDYVNLLHQYGLYAVLDLHWNAAGNAPATRQQFMASMDRSLAFWSSVAGKFKNDPAVLFDLYNEPHGISYACWRDGCTTPAGWRAAGMQHLVNAVRATGASQPIVLSGNYYGNDLNHWLSYKPNDPLNALVASVHKYNFSGCITATGAWEANSPGCWDKTIKPVAAVVPVVAGEIGEDDCAHGFIDRFMDWMDSIDAGYIGWGWYTGNCKADSALIEDYSGNPTDYGIGLRDHLGALVKGYDTTAPSVPAGLTASAISSSETNLVWTASTDNTGVVGYDIYRGGGKIATSAANSYRDTGLAANTSYTYTVAAYDAAGNTSAQSANASATTLPPGFRASSGILVLTAPAPPTRTTVGYAKMASQSAAFVGAALFAYRQNGILISEASVPAVTLRLRGRIFSDTSANIRTGIAITNPNDQPVTLSFFFTDAGGVNFGAGTTTVPANGQMARFLNEPPFMDALTAGAPFANSRTFTFEASLPVAVVALRGLINERSEFLMTTLPVIDLSDPITDTIVLPHFADGGGWSSKLVLMNPTDVLLTGSGAFTAAEGQVDSAFYYAIPPRSATTLSTSGSSQTTRSGQVRITPSVGQTTPSGMMILSFARSGFTVTQAGILATRPSHGLEIFVEATSSETGLAIANASDTGSTVTLALTDLAGNHVGPAAVLNLPAQGQQALFLRQLPEFATVSVPFQGLLRVTSEGGAVAAAALRGTYNERFDFLISTMPVMSESNASPPLVFPHIVYGGGYTTQFVLFGVSAGPPAATIQFFTESGESWNVQLRN